MSWVETNPRILTGIQECLAKLDVLLKQVNAFDFPKKDKRFCPTCNQELPDVAKDSGTT